MADNNSRRLASLVSLDLLDPLLEAMLDGILVPGSGNVSVELNFIPFMVNENEMDHQWHPGPMEVDDAEDKDEEEDENRYLYGEEEEEEEEEEDEEEEERHRYHYHRHHHHDYSREYEDEDEEEEEEEEEEGEGEGEGENENEGEEEEEGNEIEYEYDVGDEDVDDDDEDEELGMGFIDDSVLANYGSLGWSICHNISSRKILNDTFSSRDFLRQMVEYFFKHLKQSSVSSTVSLQVLLSCLPSIGSLKNLITKTKYTMKEAIVIKVVLELYENYYKTFGAPNFKVYHTEVIPLLLDFYNRLPDAALKLMSKQLTRVLLNLNNLMAHFKVFNTKQEYMAHYRDATRRMRNLSECTDPSLFLR